MLALALLFALGGRLGLLRTPLGCPQGLLPVGEHRVYEVHVGAHRLLGDSLRGLRLALVLLGQPLGRLPVLLGLGTQTVDGLLEEDLGKLGTLLLSLGATFDGHFVGLYESIGKLLGSLVYPLLTLLVDHRVSYFPSCCYT